MLPPTNTFDHFDKDKLCRVLHAVVRRISQYALSRVPAGLRGIGSPDAVLRTAMYAVPIPHAVQAVCMPDTALTEDQELLAVDSETVFKLSQLLTDPDTTQERASRVMQDLFDWTTQNWAQIVLQDASTTQARKVVQMRTMVRKDDVGFTLDVMMARKDETGATDEPILDCAIAMGASACYSQFITMLSSGQLAPEGLRADKMLIADVEAVLRHLYQAGMQLPPALHRIIGNLFYAMVMSFLPSWPDWLPLPPVTGENSERIAQALRAGVAPRNPLAENPPKDGSTQSGWSS